MHELSRLNLFHSEIEPKIAKMIVQGEYDQALRAIKAGVTSFCFSTYVIGHTLYLSGFDNLIERLGSLMHDDPQGKSEWTPGTARMLVLSEFSNIGGHSLVTADLVQAMGGAVVVLTDLFDRNHAGIEYASSRMPMAMAHRLLKLSLFEKVQELQAIFRAVRPASVMFMTHHQDPIPYVAAASLPRSVKKIFIHHCDHNPSLGGTLDGYVHVDFTRHLQDICSKQLQRKIFLLPLFVPDGGIKTFSTPVPGAINIVTSGSPNKYKFEGPFAYHLVVAEILAASNGKYWHIGALNEPALELIKSTLRERGIDDVRFTYIQTVPSLWSQLKELDAHVYLGSFPLGGGRSSIEAQGCGYPTMYFSSDDRPPLLMHAEHYTNLDLGWRSVPELIEKLKTACENHQQRVARSREFYLQGYGQEAFMRTLNQLLA